MAFKEKKKIKKSSLVNENQLILKGIYIFEIKPILITVNHFFFLKKKKGNCRGTWHFFLYKYIYYIRNKLLLCVILNFIYSPSRDFRLYFSNRLKRTLSLITLDAAEELQYFLVGVYIYQNNLRTTIRLHN